MYLHCNTCLYSTSFNLALFSGFRHRMLLHDDQHCVNKLRLHCMMNWLSTLCEQAEATLHDELMINTVWTSWDYTSTLVWTSWDYTSTLCEQAETTLHDDQHCVNKLIEAKFYGDQCCVNKLRLHYHDDQHYTIINVWTNWSYTTWWSMWCEQVKLHLKPILAFPITVMSAYQCKDGS